MKSQHQLEINSPQLVGRDSELWLNLIKRDIPGWESKPHEPRDPQNWWKVYKKLKREAQQDIDQGTQKLKAAFANIKEEKEQNLTQLKTRRELPSQHARPSMRAKLAHGYISGKTGSKGGHSMTLMERIRKQAHTTQTKSMADLKKQSSRITKAPPDFLNSRKQIPSRQQTSSPALQPRRLSAPPLAPSCPGSAPPDRSFQDREARLRALTSGRPFLSQGDVPVPLTGPTSAKRKASPSDPPPLKRSRLAESLDDLF